MRKVDYGPKVCGVCGKTFERPANQRGAMWAKRVYCSPACVNEARRRKAYERRPVHVCPICGDEFRSSHPNHVTCRKPKCKDRYKVEIAGVKQSETTLAKYASGERLPAAGVSPRELALWPVLKNAGWQWRTKWWDAWGCFELDFCKPAELIAVEIDGPEHFHPKRRARDAARDAELARRGWRVLRVANADVDADPAAVLGRIAAFSVS